MKGELINKIKRTLSKYEVDLTDYDLRKLITELEPIFKTDILNNLPTIKEINQEYNELIKPSQLELGLTIGAKHILTRIKKL